MSEKSADAFRTISEVAEWLGTPTHVLRFWESKFSQVKPVKRAGGRRYYRPADMQLLGGIKKLLHDDGMTIKGVQKLLRENGIRYVSAMSQPLDDELERLMSPTTPGMDENLIQDQPLIPPTPERPSMARPIEPVQPPSDPVPTGDVVPFEPRPSTPADPEMPPAQIVPDEPSAEPTPSVTLSEDNALAEDPALDARERSDAPDAPADITAEAPPAPPTRDENLPSFLRNRSDREKPALSDIAADTPTPDPSPSLAQTTTPPPSAPAPEPAQKARPALLSKIENTDRPSVPFVTLAPLVARLAALRDKMAHAASR